MIGFPFDSLVTYDEHGNPSYDRAVSSKPLKSLIQKLFTTGVMPNPSNNLQVFAGAEGMTVTVKAGFCVIEGGLKLEENDRTLEVQAADAVYDRIDTVVMRWNGNDNARVCDLYVVMGTAAASPVRPDLNRVGSIYEIGLADIFIPANSSVITQQRITDTRYDTARCGIVSSVSEWDTTTIYTQVQADLQSFQDTEEADFLVWYDTIKDMIDELTAAQLESEIQALSNDTVHSFNTRKGAVTLTSQDVIDALGYTPASTGGVTSFNTRTGAVTLTSADVTTALGYTPPTTNTTYSGSSTVTLTGTTFSLTKANVTTALGYTPPQQDTTYNFSGSMFYSGSNSVAEHNANNIATNGVYYYSSNGPATSIGASTADGALYAQAYSSSWVGQIAQDYRNGDIFVRGKNNGSWTSWHRPIASSVNGYTVSKSVPADAKFTDTNTASGITRSATTYVPGTNVEASLVQINKVNVFNVATASWATDSTYGYKYTISTTEYTANSSPMWMMISNSGASTVPTATELTEGAKVLVAMFTASNIVLYAKEKPSVNLKLLVKGV